MTETGLKVVIFGGTGGAGQGIVRACLDAPEVTSIVAPTRRGLGLGDHAKLTEIQIADFGDADALEAGLGVLVEGADACFFALGVSQSQVPEEDRYRVIVHDYALEAAKLMRARAPESSFHFISGSGTKEGSRMMWSRVKAEAERDLGQLGLHALVCYRPGYIHPEQMRAKPLAGERLMRGLYPLLRGFEGMSIQARQIGQAMLQAQAEGLREGILENAPMRALAGRYCGLSSST